MSTTPTRTDAQRELPTAGVWDVDPSHSTVQAIVRHLMVSKVRGSLDQLSGSVVVADRPEDSTVEIEIDAASIDTGEADRDAHLRSADFLDTDRYPTITFRSTRVEQAGDTWKVHGDLTIRGVSHPVALDTTFQGALVDPFGLTRAVWSAETEIDREDFEVTWNQTLEAGGVMVSKRVGVEIELQATLRK